MDAHQKLLNIRCLVIDKKEEIDNYIDFAKMAQDNHNTELSSRILLELREELKMSQELLIQTNCLEKRLKLKSARKSLMNIVSH